MAQQELDRLWMELQSVEQDIKAKVQELLEAMKANELPELIALIGKEKDRLVEEKKDLWQLLSALQAQLAGSAESERIATALENVERMTRDILLSQFAPSASTDTTRQSANRKLVEDIYRPEDAPNGMGWCMALGRWLPRDQLKASHVYQRRWPLGVAGHLEIDVDGPGNIIMLQKKVERAFVRLQLIILPESDNDFRLYLLDPTLADCMISNDIKDPSGAAVRCSALEGKLLDFATDARPAKRSLAYHAQVSLHFGKRKKKPAPWPAAHFLKVPAAGWQSDTCDVSILRERYLFDQSALVDALASDSEAS